MGNTIVANPSQTYCSCCGKNITGVVSYYDNANKKYKCVSCGSSTTRCIKCKTLAPNGTKTNCNRTWVCVTCRN